MKKIIITIVMMAITLVVNAQVEANAMDSKKAENATSPTIQQKAGQTQQTVTAPKMEVDESGLKPEGMETDTACRKMMYLPGYAIRRPWLFTTSALGGPFGWGGLWDVHEGLNAEIGMGVMVGFGKNNPFKGASFYEDATLLYAKSLGKHWSVALGGSLSRFKMWNKNEFCGDVFALGNYKFDDHWSASIYASYNHMPAGMGFYGMYGMFGGPDMMNFNENVARIGGEVTYKFNEKCAVSVGVSADVPIGNNKPWQPQHPINQDNRQNINNNKR